MPSSTAPVAGADITASGVGLMRRDAIFRTETAIAGETIAAYTTAGSITFPTVVYRAGTKWFKAIADGVVQAAGFVQDVALAFTAAAGDGSTFEIVKPGSQITTEFFPSIAGLTVGGNYFPSPTVAGGIATYDASLTKSYRLLGYADTTTSFDFTPTHNSTLLQGNIAIFTSASAITRLDLVYLNTSGKMARTDATSKVTGYVGSVGVAFSAASGADVPLLVRGVGTITQINGSPFTAGQPVFISDTPGQGSHTRGRFTRQVGVAVSTTLVYICPLDPEDNVYIEIVQADDPWTIGDFLYRKSSNGRAARSDCDLAEPGIAEVPYIAASTQLTGAGSWQPVFLPGSVLTSVITGTAGTKLWNSATIGGRSTTFPGHDLYTRLYGYFIDTNRFFFFPEASRFMPTGEQEKGYAAAGTRNDTTDADTAADRVDVGICFNKVMVNTPSSITLAMVSDFGTPTASANDITRYGFRLRVAATGSGIYYWTGTYTTVGN